MPPPRGIVQRLDQELHKSLLLPRHAKLLVAVSGGADSVALLRLLYAINQSDFWHWTLVVGHVDHGMRGRASKADARFTQKLAASLRLPCITKTFKLGKHASEDAARTARLGALESIARAQKCFAAVLAHHADDQAETVLLRLFRGAGLGALAGIAPDATIRKLRILRPLLAIRREELRRFLKQLGQDFREDQTNATDLYLRNRLRKILPQVERLAPGAVSAIARTASLARQTQHFIDSHHGPLLASSLILQTPRRVRFHRGPLQAADPLLVAELLRHCIVQLGGTTQSSDFERITHAVHLVQSSASGKHLELGRGVHLHVDPSADPHAYPELPLMTDSPSPNRDALLDEIRDLALQAAKEDRDSAAVELFHGYLKYRPHEGFIWFRLGVSLRDIGLNHEAENALNRAIELSPKQRGRIMAHLGKLQHNAGRYAEAENSYAQACQDPEQGQRGSTWILRGANLARATQLRAAEDCHRKALTFHDEHVDRDEAYVNLGYVLRAQGRYTEAAEAFQSALDITPDYPEALQARSSLIGIAEAIAKAKQLDS